MSVPIDVISNNKTAIRSYEKSGFVVEFVVREGGGVLRDGQKLDRIYMVILSEEWRSKTSAEMDKRE